MRSRATRAEHQAAVERRLAQLSAELASARGEASPRPEVEVAPAAGGEWWSDHTVVPGRLHVVPPVPPHDGAGDPTPTPLPAPLPPPLSPPVPPPVPLPVQRVPDPEPGAGRVVRAPGRHAAARRGSRARDLVEEVVPESLRGRALIGPAQLAVIAVVVAVGAVVTALLVVRSDPEPPEVTVAAGQEGSPLVPLPTPGGAPGTDGGDAEAAAPGGGAALPAGSAAGTVTVDVAGKVRRPGIAVLDAGARVVDAIEAAGGTRPGVDLSTLNLARLLVDGEQILVGESAAPVPDPLPGGAVPGAVPGAPALVNLNTATAEQLDALPEVGPVTAAAIIGWREQNGAFTAVEELLEVDGIGEATLAQIAPHATV